MKQYLVGFCAGVIICTVPFLLIVMDQRENSFVIGKNNGEIAARYEIYNIINHEFGKADPKEGYEPLFTIKSQAVGIVTVNDVKTIRIVH